MGSLALVGDLPRDSVSIKYGWLWHLINATLNMSQMSNKKSLNNGEKEAGMEGESFSPSTCPVVK